MTVTAPLKVLVVAGCGRSGSTLLTTVLGQIDGFVAIGEVANLWSGILENRMLCTCTHPYAQCPFWSRVLGTDLLDPRRIRNAVAAEQRLVRRPIFRRPAFRAANRRELDDAADRYAALFGEVYRRVRRISGCDVVVDNSKRPAHGYAIRRLPDCESYVLHLVRDPRAVAFSAQRHAGRHVRWSARYWMRINLKAEYFWGARLARPRYLRICYEDFAAEPRRIVEKILRFLGEERALDVFMDDRTVQLSRSNHHVEGHPDRYPVGPMKIVPDQRWSSGMSRKNQLSMVALTWPLLLRYGYTKASFGFPPAGEHLRGVSEAS